MNPWKRIPYSVMKSLVEEAAESGHSLRTICIAWLMAVEDHLQTVDLSPPTPALIQPEPLQSVSVKKQIMFKLVAEALHKTNGNQRKASAMLGIPKSKVNDYVKRMRVAL